MAIVRIPDENRSLQEHDEVRDYLAAIGIDYEYCEPVTGVPSDASVEQILNVYAKQIDELKRRGGYVTADVIDVNHDTPGLDAMLAKFNIEHRHDEDEVRYIVNGRGLFHIHPQQGSVAAIEVEAGDLIRVPRGTLHWFDLSAIGEFAQYVYSKICLAGRHTIHIVELIENTNLSVGVRGTFLHKKPLQRNRACDLQHTILN